MMFTLAWKEIREHQGIWITMVILSVVLGLGLAKFVALGDANLDLPVAAFTILAMAATYGVVCGAMMFAGEHEGGTLVFLDVFLGRRGLLWLGKFAIGAVLVLTQALAVALALRLLEQEMPAWAMALVGQRVEIPLGGVRRAGPSVWFVILPVVTLEAFAWGLLGSSLSKRVLAGAAVAAVGFTPVLLLSLCAPARVFIFVRLAATGFCLAISYAMFLRQAEETTLAPPVKPDKARDAKDRFLDQWEEFERDDKGADDRRTPGAAVILAAPGSTWAEADRQIEDRPSDGPEPFADEPVQAKSPRPVVWWLTFAQAKPLLPILGAVSLLTWLIIPANSQVLWPLVTMLLGVACGTAAFAPEQRDLSYQFLAAQHFPLNVIWRFKIAFWLAVSVLAAVIMFVGVILVQRLRREPPFQGTLHDLMGSISFFGVWLIYGFCVGQVVVWLCRKTILALLVSFLATMAAIGLWLPSLLCGGTGGWQLWALPLVMLLAARCVLRAWAGGRIWERKPLAALLGFGAAALVWALVYFTYRAVEIPDVGDPLDPTVFRANLPTAKDNAAARAIQQAIGELNEPNEPWLASMAEAARFPPGMLELPRSDGQFPVLIHLPACEEITDKLLKRARQSKPGPAFEYLAQILALSRSLRNKAPLESYLAGVRAEGTALTELDQVLARGKPDPLLLRRVLDELNRHDEETPPPLDCVETECFFSAGIVANPSVWTFAAPGVGRDTEHWLKGGIALSLETPWEEERKTRLWRLVWSGLFRAVQTPHWQRPVMSNPLRVEKDATQRILRDWRGDAAGPAAGMTRGQIARLLDHSWLADDMLFCSIARLGEAATRSSWRVDAKRQLIALALYRLETGRPADKLQDLVPKYLPTELPLDPYSGELFRYRIEPNGQEIVWSTGPDRIDHGGQMHGGNLGDDDIQWRIGAFDLIMRPPQWP